MSDDKFLDWNSFFLPLQDDMAHIDPEIFKKVVESFTEPPPKQIDKKNATREIDK